MATVSAVTTAMSTRPSTAFQRFTDYVVQRDDKAHYFGTDGDTNLQFVSAQRCLRLERKGMLVDFDGADLSERLVLVKKWLRAPGINADIQNAAEATREIVDTEFEVLGVNASSDDVTLNVEGGLKLETDGADGDEVILLPHLDANQSAWATTTWGSDQESRFECYMKTGTSIAKTIIWAGFKLTNTEVVATDNDQAFIRYEDDVNSGKFQCVYSIGGTDTTADSGVTVATSTVYHLVVSIDSSRIPTFYINGALVATGTALTDATDFIPYFGIAADGAAPGAKHCYHYWQKCSRKYA